LGEGCDAGQCVAPSVEWTNTYWALEVGQSAIAANGDLLVAGSFRAQIDLGGGQLYTAGGTCQSGTQCHDIVAARFDADGNHQWSKAFGTGSGSEPSDEAYGLVPTDDNGMVVAGYINGAVDFGGDPIGQTGKRAFVAKFDADGTHVWSKAFGGAGAHAIYDVGRDGDENLYLTGSTSGYIDFGGGNMSNPENNANDLFLVKLSPNGDHVWSKRYGGVQCNSSSVGVAVSPDGKSTITGSFSCDSLEFGECVIQKDGEGYSAFLAHFDSSGNCMWASTVSPGGFEYRATVAYGPAGEVYLLQHWDKDWFLRSYDSSGVLGWSKLLSWTTAQLSPNQIQPGHRMAMDATGDIYLTGEFTFVSLGGGGFAAGGLNDRKIFAGKLDSEGNHLWSTVLPGSNNYAIGGSIALGADGAVYVVSKHSTSRLEQ